MTISRILKVPVYFSGFIILSLVFGYLTFKILSFSRIVEVPDLKGKSALEANAILNKSSLHLQIQGEEYDSAISPGYVLMQDVPAGNKIKEQRAVKVILSKGPKVKSVPSVFNETLDRAEYAFLQQGLKAGHIIYVHSNTIEKNRIIAQKPEPDETLTGEIVLIVSRGPYEATYHCPNLQGMDLEAAIKLVQGLALKVEVAGSGEKVRAQKPAAGAFIKSGATIFIYTEGGSVANG